MGTLEKIHAEIYALENKFATLGIKKETFLIEAGFAWQAMKKNDYLAKCSTDSIKTSVYNLALTGLTLNPALAYAYLVPRKLNKNDKYPQCVLDISYRGLVKLATDSGGIKSVHGSGVYENDFFDAQEGTTPFIEHRPLYFGDRGNFIGAYVVATLPDGSKKHTIMSKNDIEKVRAVSQMKGGGPWAKWYEEMAIKTVIKRARKLWPHSDKLATAVEILNQGEGFEDYQKQKTKTAKQISRSSLDIAHSTVFADDDAPAQTPCETLKTSDIVVPEKTKNPWSFGNDDPEKRISDAHKNLIIKSSNENNVSLEQGLFQDMGFENMSDIRNKDLYNIGEYFNA